MLSKNLVCAGIVILVLATFGEKAKISRKTRGKAPILRLMAKWDPSRHPVTAPELSNVAGELFLLFQDFGAFLTNPGNIATQALDGLTAEQ